MAKVQSPTFDLVIAKFKEAMTADELISDDVRDRLIDVLTTEGTPTVPKLEAALKPAEDAEDGS